METLFIFFLWGFLIGLRQNRKPHRRKIPLTHGAGAERRSKPQQVWLSDECPLFLVYKQPVIFLLYLYMAEREEGKENSLSSFSVFLLLSPHLSKLRQS